MRERSRPKVVTPARNEWGLPGTLFVNFCEQRAIAHKSENGSSRKSLTCGYFLATRT